MDTHHTQLLTPRRLCRLPLVFFNDTATTEIYTLSLHDALPICWIHRAHEVFDSPEGLELLASWGLPADGSLRGVGHCILGYAEDTLPEPKPRRDNVVYVR